MAPQNEGSKWIDVERHSEKWRDFEREIEGKSGAANAAAGEVEDEDIAVVGLTQAQQAGIRNQRCPISGKDIGDLDDPVRDSKGYIYERIAIEGYLSQGRGRHISKRCPVAGANHMVAVADLVGADAGQGGEAEGEADPEPERERRGHGPVMAILAGARRPKRGAFCSVFFFAGETHEEEKRKTNKFISLTRRRPAAPVVGTAASSSAAPSGTAGPVASSP